MQALRNAVQQKVGAYIDAETIVANEEIFKDEILDYSAGFVEDYERLGVESIAGMIEVRLRAKVREDKLHKRIKETFKASTKVDGQKVFQVASTLMEKEKDARQLLRTIASEFPEKAIIVEVAAPKTIRSFEDGSVEIGLRTRFSIAPDFVARLQKAIHAISPRCTQLNSVSQVLNGWEDIRMVKNTGVVISEKGRLEFCVLSQEQYWTIIAGMMSGDHYIWPQMGMGEMWLKLGEKFAENQFPSVIQPRLRIELHNREGGIIGTKEYDAFGNLKWLSPKADMFISQGPGWWYFAEGLVRFCYFDTFSPDCPPEPVDLSALPGVPDWAAKSRLMTVPPPGSKYPFNALLMIEVASSKERLYKYRVSVNELKDLHSVVAYYVSPLKQRNALGP